MHQPTAGRANLGRAAWSAAAVIALACSAAPTAQNLVQINEIHFDDQWIEIANFDTSPVDLSAWSIYQATQTPGAPQAYWWGIPAGTVIPARGFLRVRWLHPVQLGNTNPLLLDTGDTTYPFLFFLRAEPLARSSGALALAATKDAVLVNVASYYRDFVAWGTPAGQFAREALAVANGRWIEGARTLAASSGQSLALDSTSLLEPTPASAFFRDNSPTPSAANHATQSATVYGTSCVLGLGAPAQLTLASIPVHGNADFRILVDNLGDSRTMLTLLFGLPLREGRLWGPVCRTYVDLDGPFSILAVAVSGDRLAYRPNIEDFNIPELAVQAVALLPNGSTVTTNGGLLRN